MKQGFSKCPIKRHNECGIELRNETTSYDPSSLLRCYRRNIALAPRPTKSSFNMSMVLRYTSSANGTICSDVVPPSSPASVSMASWRTVPSTRARVAITVGRADTGA